MGIKSFTMKSGVLKKFKDAFRGNLFNDIPPDFLVVIVWKVW